MVDFPLLCEFTGVYPKIHIWKDFQNINRWLSVWGMFQVFWSFLRSLDVHYEMINDKHMIRLTVDVRSPAPVDMIDIHLCTYMVRVWNIPCGAGFLPSTVWLICLLQTKIHSSPTNRTCYCSVINPPTSSQTHIMFMSFGQNYLKNQQPKLRPLLEAFPLLIYRSTEGYAVWSWNPLDSDYIRGISHSP